MQNFGLDFYTIRDVMSWKNLMLLSLSMPKYKPKKNDNKSEKKKMGEVSLDELDSILNKKF